MTPRSPEVRGALWALAASLIFACVEAMAKLAGRELDPLQIAFFRCVFGGLFVLPLTLRAAGAGTLRTKRFLGHVGRTAAGVCSIVLGFIAVTNMNLADAVAISFTRPMFLIVLAVLFLGERVRWRRWTAIAVGFVGVIVMVRPGGGEFGWPALAALAGAMSVACVVVLLKQLVATERPETIIFYFTTMSSLMTLIPALLVWRWPPPWVWAIVVAIGAFGSFGQYCSIRAYRLIEATQADPIDYSRLIFATVISVVLFADWPDIWSFVGAAIIIASTLYITRREASLKAGPAPTTKGVSHGR